MTTTSEAVEVLGVQMSVVEEATGVAFYDGEAGRLAVRIDVDDEFVLVRVFAVVQGEAHALFEVVAPSVDDADSVARAKMRERIELCSAALRELPEAA